MATDTAAPTFEMTDRLRALAAAAARRAESGPHTSRARNEERGYFELYADLPLPERQARSLAYALVNEPVFIFPGERINGIFYGTDDPLLWPTSERMASVAATPRAEARIAAEVPEFAALSTTWPQSQEGSFLIMAGAAPGHIAWNWHLILAHGVRGLMDTHREALERTDDPAAREYYQCVLIMLEAMVEWNRRHVAELERVLAEATDPAEREFIAGNLEVMRQVPEHPARNFREALQSFYFQWLCVIYEVPYGGNSPGRLDYFLWPYLREELESGALSYQAATELVAELFIKLDERIRLSDGNVITAVVGGCGPDGSDAVTPLSTMMLDAFEQMDISHPSVYVRVSEANPPQWLTRCAEYMVRGGNRAQVLADEPIIQAMTRDGHITREDAAMYMCGGCMELSPHGMNSDLLWTFFYNVPKVVELLVTGNRCLMTGQQRLEIAGPLSEFATFEDLWDAFADHVHMTLHAKFRCLDIYSQELARWRPAFLQSSMVADCLERGRGQQDGGARYHDYGASPLGLQNAADALTAIRLAVYDEGFCTPQELVAALEDDYVGHEALHARLLALPKYGQGDPVADGMMARVLDAVCGAFNDYVTLHGGRAKPMLFTFMWAAEMGRSLGASPDGRRAGAPIGHGLSPQALGMTEGLTTCMASLVSLPIECVSGGATSMWDMDSDWINPQLMEALLRTYIERGGQIFQGNTTSVRELERALDNPSAFPGLFVRVGGFSARFMLLGRDLQEEIVARHRHRG
jgi:formate C-acetyltransferase